MAYVFDPINNTLIDDEDKSLGNKFALLDSDLETAIQSLNEKFGPGTVQQGTQEIPTPPKTIEREMFEKAFKAKGGSIRQNFVAAGLAVPFAPALTYPVSLGLAKIFGLTTAGLGAKELGDNVLNYIKDNPEILNDPKFKAAALAFGINVPGYIAPDADEMEREAEKIRELTKPKGFGEGEKPDIPLKTGDSEPPKIETTESFPADEKPLPVIEGFPGETQQLPIILFNKKNKEVTEAKDTFDTIEKLYETGRSNEIPKYRTEDFAIKVKDIVDNQYGGNISKLANDLDIERVRINSLFKKYGIKPLREGNKTMQTIFLEQDQDKLFLKDLTDEMKYDDQYLIDRIKKRYPNYEQDKKKYFNFKDLAEMTGMTFRTDNVKTLKSDQGDFLTRLRKTNEKFDLKTQPGFGKETKYQLEDFVKKFTKYNLSKPVQGTGNYQSKLRRNFLLEQDTKLVNVKDSVTGEVRKITKDVLGDNFTQYALEQIGHGVGVNNQIAYSKLFKNSNVGIATEVLQDPVLNTEVLSGRNSTIKGYESSERKFYSILEDLIGKKATDENIKIAMDAVSGLNELRNKAANDERLNTNFLKDQSNRVPTFVLDLPEAGKKFKSGFLNVDMSNIDPSVSVGRILEINPDAKTFDDLSKEEQELYKENLKQQLADYAKYFYTEAKLDKDDVNDLFEALMEDDSIKMKKASGGGVEITPLPRSNFGNGGAAGADVDFATELEYFFTNPDAELPVMQTYKETNNPVEVLNDIINPRNYPYYADVLARSGIRIGEFGARLLPATGKLISDLIQKPAFKVKSTEDNYVRDYLDPPPPSNIKGTGIFSEFLENITPTTLEKKVGLDKLIEKEEQRLKDTGSTVGPKVFADTIGLGAEVTAPIFPGLKLLRAYAKNRNLPVNNVTKEILVKEIDEVLAKQGMNRREFLQVTGAGATVILAKMLGFGDEVAQTAKVAEKAAAAPASVPPYFFDLVEIIKKKGIDTTKRSATKNLENVFTYKGYEVYEDLATGEIRIEKISPEADMITERQILEFKPGRGDESNPKPADEYEEVTETHSRIIEDNYNDPDYEEGINIEEILEFIKNEKAN